MRLYIEGIGLLGPGLESWSLSQAVLTGIAAYQTAPTLIRSSDMLPAAERRRAGVPIKLAMAVGQEALLQSGRAAQTVATVFTSSSGDNDNAHAINNILATAPLEMSPTRFHNSVHNAAAGYWCIATGSHAPSSSLSAFDTSFAAGLLESAAQVTMDDAVVALIAYDHPHPEPLNTVRTITASFGMALLLAPHQTERALAMIELELVSGTTDETTMHDSGLEALRRGIPAARGLPLLSALADGSDAHIRIACTTDHYLQLHVTPC